LQEDDDGKLTVSGADWRL